MKIQKTLSRPENETNEAIGKWATDTFGNCSEQAGSLRILEECVELCIISGCRISKIQDKVQDAMQRALMKKKEKHRCEKLFDIGMELADIFVTSCHVAASLNLDFKFFTQAKMKINRARKWRRNGDGTGQHIG